MKKTADHYEELAIYYLNNARNQTAQVYATLAMAAAVSEQTEAQRPVRIGIG